MNIVFFIGHLKHGGAEGVVATLTSELANRGHQITLVCSLRNQVYNVSDGVKIIDVCSWQYNTTEGNLLQRLYKKIANRFLDLKHINDAIKKEQPDLVISFLVNWLWQIIVICKGRIPIISAERNAMACPHSSKNVWNKQVLYRLVDAVQVMSRYDKAWLRGRYKRVYPMPNPLRFTPIEQEKYDSLFSNRKNILACGRVNRQKGFDKLILAFSQIQSNITEWNVDICGDIENQEYYNYLNRIIEEKGLQGRINFMGPRYDVDSVMQEHSIFCLSSQHEGFPNVLSEAMANGMACISFDIVTGPSEIIIDGLDGIIVEDQNVDALAKGLLDLVADKELRYDLGVRAIHNIKRYNKIRIVALWESFFQSVINDYKK